MAQPWTSFGGLTLALMLVLPALAEEKKEKIAEDKPALEQSANDQTAADLYAVPEGTPKELKAFIQNIIRTMPQDEESSKKARAAMFKAAEKMIAGQSDDDELDFAADVKMRSLNTANDIKAFSDALKKAGHEKQSQTARSYSLQIGMRDAIMSGKTDLQKKQIAAVLKYFKEAPPRPTDLSLAIMAGQIAELQGDNAYALDTYRNLSKVFSESKDQELAEFGKRLEGVVRRLSLLGNKLHLEGKLLSGEAFDYSKYKGKVVLVDFWASWRQPCASDLPKMKNAYELYRGKGFDIIGFGCDYLRAEAENFVKERDIPWATVYGDNSPSPTIEYYGILALPTMILVGKDGNVKELNVNADDLAKQLEKLLGPVEEKK